VGSKKKNNTAFKDEQDFAADILAEELKGVLKSVPDQNADEFFDTLKREMLEEGVVIEKSVVTDVPEPDEFTNIDIVPENLKNKDKDRDINEYENSGVHAEAEDSVVELFNEENNDDDEFNDVKTNADEDLDFSMMAAEDEEAKAAPAHEPKLSQEEADAAVDEIFSKEPSHSVKVEEEKIKAVRVFEDKTAAIQSLSDETEMVDDARKQDLSNLDNVSSMQNVKANMLHKFAQRNPSIDLKNADYIKFAQGKIKNLEKDLANLRIETQELALAGSHFKALAEEREQRNKSLEAKVSELQSTSVEEKKILNSALEAKETKIGLLQERVESLEVELESKYNRLRVRERELESRLEILKQEQDAVASSKDDLILRVKKQNNALTADLDRARAQSQKSASLLQDKEDALRRTIKALKLSLTMLESQKQN